MLREAQPARERVVLDGRGEDREAVEYTLERWRFALGIDDDLRAFHERFRRDALIGASVRRAPHLRPGAGPSPSRRWPGRCASSSSTSTGRPPSSGRSSGAGAAGVPRPACATFPTRRRSQAPRRPSCESLWPEPESRAIALVRAAREVTSGRADLHAPDHERAWRRLRAIPGIGPWTVEMLALRGQGRLDQVPAGDLGLRKLVGRIRSGGNPRARVDEDEVRAFFAPYAPWAGLAARHALNVMWPGAPAPV